MSLYGQENNCTSKDNKLKILFLCTGNSCRSQMAEGLCRLLKSDYIEPFSAGLETHGLNPLAIKALSEIDIDMTTHKSQLLEEFSDINFDFVVTVCNHAHETCPAFPGNAIVIHKGFDDPPKLAKNATTEEEALVHYRRVRDEIKDFVITLPQALHS